MKPGANAVAIRPTLVGAIPKSKVLRVPKRRMRPGANGVVKSIATTHTDIGMAMAMDASIPSEGSYRSRTKRGKNGRESSTPKMKKKRGYCTSPARSTCTDR